MEARSSKLDYAELLSSLFPDELDRRTSRRAERRRKVADLRDPERTLDAFEFDFNKKMNRILSEHFAAPA